MDSEEKNVSGEAHAVLKWKILSAVLLFLVLLFGGLLVVSLIPHRQTGAETASGAAGKRVYADAASSVSAQDLEKADLVKLGTRALRDRGFETKCAAVKLAEQLPDGSWQVVLVLQNGRSMKGRLYRHRNRLRIALDLISVFE